MWVELDGGLPAAYPDVPVAICSVLEAIASASFHGRHALYGSRGALQWMHRAQLSAPSKAAIARALSTAAERGAVRASLSNRLLVRPGNGRVSKDDAGNWQAPIEALVGIPFQAVSLLAENLRDAEALELAAEHYRSHSGQRALHICVRRNNGGGAAIVQCLAHGIAERQQFILAITDSDKDFPEAGSSTASMACIQAVEPSDWIAEHLELPCREIENLLPTTLVADAIESIEPNSEMTDRMARLTALTKNRPDVLLYSDLKHGLLGKMATEAQVNQQRRQYWASVASSCNVKVCSPNCESAPCSCEMIPAIGQNVLRHFLDHCSRQSLPKQVERAKAAPLWTEWRQIGKSVFAWALADPPVRV